MPTTSDTNSTVTYRGLALPASRARGGYFGSKSTRDRVFGDLLMATLTPIGGRVMRREFGSGLPRLVMTHGLRPDDPVVQGAVTDAAAAHCPQAAVRAVRVSVTRGKASVQVSFGVAGQPSLSDAPVGDLGDAVGNLQGGPV